MNQQTAQQQVQTVQLIIPTELMPALMNALALADAMARVHPVQATQLYGMLRESLQKAQTQQNDQVKPEIPSEA